jgi:putative restriction endonuclease
MWFIGVLRGVYDPICPVTLAGEEPAQHQFVLAVDETMRRGWRPGLLAASPFDPTTRYAEAALRVRLHQRVFPDRVLPAYGSQ